MTLGIVINAVFFLGMGISALVKPSFVISFVKMVPETVDARNEVRAVYGGFGIAVSILLVYAAHHTELRSGVLIAVAAALLGMALGRVVSVLVERPGRWPYLFMIMETALAGMLLWSL
jgi:presenilin-like A22 family membrane protease